jgi:hypothetical protein
MQRLSTVILLIVFLAANLDAQPTFGTDPFISFEKGALTISAGGKSAPMLISSGDWAGVIRAFRDLQSDIGKVSSSVPEIYLDKIPGSKEIIIAGTIGKSPLIDEIISRKKINITDISGKWESFTIQVVRNPLKGVKKALVIAGSDKRGTIYGIYELSRQIGVSPWYWWGDIPVTRRNAIFALDKKYTGGTPSVRYRGIFLNDEAPDLSNWIRAKYGTVKTSGDPPMPNGVSNYGREFYTKLFELLLRLKANYLWPAMWNNAFNEDDPENPRLADEYGIVMGNSHQEPMLRAQKEWDRRYQRSVGSWNYAKNPDLLEAFWREGIRRNKDYESIVTIGLRGANDTPMAPGGPEANKTLLETIVGVQRKMLAEEMNREVTKIPQLWCLYKEVQDYYNAGMRVPDDVTLLWAEDNWGNVRRLPTAEERLRTGGAGIYYHFDYHGGPRSYQWINSNPVAKIWDQMSLAKQYGADRIWIVNAGHFKGYEFPIEYFLDLAWNNERLTADNINEYTRYWAAREFGSEFADESAEIMSLYTRFNGRRKPELLAPTTYSLVNYREAERITADYKALSDKAESLFNRLPAEKKDAFYQLLLFPAKASAIVNELYLAAGKNNLYYRQGRASAGVLADHVQILFDADTSLMGYFNRDFAGGKWNHFMDQSHLGYTSWADPPVNSLRAVNLKRTDLQDNEVLGVSVEGTESVWPGSEGSPELPVLDNFNRQEFYIDVFNKGKGQLDFKASSKNSWVIIRREKGPLGTDERLWISVDWNKIENGINRGSVRIEGAGSEVEVSLTAFKPEFPTPESLEGFVENNGYVSIEAEHFSLNTRGTDRSWSLIEGYGHTLSGMRASSVTDAPSAVPGKDAPCMEYKMYLFTPGDVEVTGIFSPTLNFIPGRDMKYAISFDEQAPSIITLVPGNYNAQNRNADWEKSVSDNARFSLSSHKVQGAGYHTLKIWMIDPGPVLQKVIINTGGLKSSYLGPPESFHNKINTQNK